MQGIFSRPFANLDLSDLLDLVQVRKVREHIHLDYKREPYEHNHSDTVEMLADVTAMANAQGGYIVIGVEEDDTEPDGTPKELVGIECGDQEAMWIQSVCLSSIDEKIIGLRVRDIPLADGHSCVVIQIPNSVRKPHMIVHQKHRSFRIRHGRSKSLMGMQEVRSMIINMSMYRASLVDFLYEQKQAIKDVAQGQPWLLLMATPIYVDTEKVDPLQEDIRDVLFRAPGRLDKRFAGIHSGVPEPRLFGVEAIDPKAGMQPSNGKALRLFRSGHLEYCQSLAATAPEGWPEEKALPIYSYRITVMLMQFLEVARQAMQLAEINEPVAVTLYLQNVVNSYLHRWERSIPPFRLTDGIFFWHGETLNIGTTVSEMSDPTIVARLVIDRLFNAFGYEDNPHFDPNGDFMKW